MGLLLLPVAERRRLLLRGQGTWLLISISPMLDSMVGFRENLRTRLAVAQVYHDVVVLV